MDSDNDVTLSQTKTAGSSGTEVYKQNGHVRAEEFEESLAKRIKLDGQPVSGLQTAANGGVGRRKGVAPVKKE